jgi:hypothetical protein
MLESAAQVSLLLLSYLLKHNKALSAITLPSSALPFVLIALRIALRPDLPAP